MPLVIVDIDYSQNPVNVDEDFTISIYVIESTGDLKFCGTFNCGEESAV